MKDHRIWMCGVAIAAALVAVAYVLGAMPLSARAKAPQQTPLLSLLLPSHLGYGINVRLEENIDPIFAPLGLEWIKLWEEYERNPPAERLPYQVLFVLDRREGMPADLDQWGDHVEAIARAGRGFVEAYEIGNEPNVERFWDNAPPDP
ncbi:MAG: hypothetical protein V3S14_17320, partial [Anaerolineae bacterium]